VKLDVEIRVVDPVRAPEPERHRDEPLPERLGEVQPRLEDRAHRLQRPLAAGRGGGVEQYQAADVADGCR
jgi:hypothetical protein